MHGGWTDRREGGKEEAQHEWVGVRMDDVRQTESLEEDPVPAENSDTTAAPRTS